MSTEGRNPRSTNLSDLGAASIVALMNAEERVVLEALGAVVDELAFAAAKVAEVVAGDGRIFLLGSGTSGRLVVMEAAELPPTFGIEERFIPVIASGPTGGPAAVTQSEDDRSAAPDALAGFGCRPGDIVIGVAASGSTPFVLAGLCFARQVGAWTCGIANNASTPLLNDAAHAILLDTGPEILTGSTRLKAGTAQKLALNRITTAAMVRAGRVRSNLMVCVRPTNEKLRARAIRIVSELAQSDEKSSTGALESSDWDIRVALELLSKTTGSDPKES